MWQDRAGAGGAQQYRSINGASTYAPHQYFPPRMMFNYNPRLGYMPPGGGYQAQMSGYLGPGPPQYRPPPPVQIHTPGRDIEVSSQWQPMMLL